MLTTGYCVLCGGFVQTENHHVIPQAHGGTDDENNLLSFCSPCHARVHEFGVRRGSMLELQRIGVEKAKAAGKYKGRTPTARARTEEVLMMLEMGMSAQATADSLGIGVASVYRIYQASGYVPPIVEKPATTITRKRVPAGKQTTTATLVKRPTPPFAKIGRPLSRPPKPSGRLCGFCNSYRSSGGRVKTGHWVCSGCQRSHSGDVLFARLTTPAGATR